ncbi:hypothetical protein WDW86_14675 [Bdellovibrionota bacterium FG-2]
MRYRNIIADSLVCSALISESSEKPNAGLLNAYLELKKKTWILVVLARFLIFLGILVNYYLGRS